MYSGLSVCDMRETNCIGFLRVDVIIANEVG